MNENTHPEPFTVITYGMLSASVCTCLSDEEATELLNLEYPCGTTTGWMISERDYSNDTNPGKCANWPDTHRHILFDC